MSVELDKKRAKGRGNRNTIDGKYHGPMPVYDKSTTPDPDKDDKYEYWNEWGVAANWFNYKCKPKDYKNYAVRYAKEYLKLPKDDIKNLKKVKDGNFLLVSKLAAIHFTGFEYHIHERDAIKGYIEDLIELGKKIVDEDVDDKPKTKVVSIQDRMRSKMMETIYNEFDEVIVESWFDKDFAKKFDAYAAIKKYEVKGASVKMFADRVVQLRDEMSDAYNNTCDQMVEAYSGWKKSHLKKAIAQLDIILGDVEKAQLANKAVRKPRASKPKASDKQVAKLNYCKGDDVAKLASVNPILIPGAKVLYMYNVKQKKLTEFVTDNDTGFIVSGSTLKNFDNVLSRTCTLRKPDEVLPQILKKTQKQIDNIFKGITTKITEPTGRINKDCILLRVITK